jgi:hypothetical protein
MLKRTRLPEFHDSTRCPVIWRDLLTDFMSFFARVHKPYRVVAGRVWDAMRHAGTHSIVDLCSGAGEPAVLMQEDLARAGFPVRVTLTDKFPNREALHKWTSKKTEAVHYLAAPVDATDVPTALKGFRTVFAAFHHFDPPAARRILADAMEKRQGIGIFEYTDRNLWLWVPVLLLSPLYLWAAAPWMRPFRWSRLLWTYLIPVVPLMGVWDGFISCLHTYTPRELEELTQDLDVPDYAWEAGRIRSFGLCRITYLIGRPDRAA